MSRAARMLSAAGNVALDVLARLSLRAKPVDGEPWLVSERGFDARDNGYWFYRFLREEHLEIDAWYAIDADAADRDRVSGIGPVVDRGSFEHRRLMAAAQVLASTHDCGYAPDSLVYHHLAKRGLFRPRGKKVFLAHGIHDVHIDWYDRDECEVDLFCCSSEAERGIITGTQGQPEDVVQKTGLCRYDSLVDDPDGDFILVMPTWRKFLQGASQARFDASEYRVRYDQLVFGDGMAQLLEERDLKIVFYPHIEMQKFYEPREEGRARIASAETDDVQALLRGCRALVTDYSSVVYDVAYMSKPCILYRFDYDRYKAEHYSEILIDNSEMATVCEGAGEVVSALDSLLGNAGGRADGPSFAETFFEYRDRENCERVFRAVQQTLRP